MSQKKLRLITSFLLLLAFFGYQIYKQYYPPTKVLSIHDRMEATTAQTMVAKVIDGDTIEVLTEGKKEKVRVIGINTPETVDPRRPVECFGKEASSYAKSLLSDKTVKLESDPTQANRDKYGRMLRYVFFSNGSDFGLTMIKEGYAYEYTYDIPYKYQVEYKIAQKEAESLKKGLWSDAACQGRK